MADDILQTLKRVQAIPEGQHWFCPRDDDDERGFYFDQDLLADGSSLPPDPSGSRAARIEKADARRDLVFAALQIFAFDGAQATPLQQWLDKELAEQLSKCDICVREYHRSRRKLKQQLMHEYDDEEVASFMQKFDGLNLRRIEGVLHRATTTLEQIEPSSRAIASLDMKGIHAVFEALTCKPFHSNEEELVNHFDKFFKTLQTKKTLKMSSYSPAMAWFLFQQNPARVQWASKEWTRMKRYLLPVEFEHVVHEALLFAMSRVQLGKLEKDFLPQFWDGVRLMVAKMDKEVITSSLRSLESPDMETDLCRLAFSHLQVDSDAFTSILGTMRHILEVSPADFWDALGTVSPTAWLDQFFASKALKRLVERAEKEPLFNTPTLDALLAWIEPFVKSIRPANQPPAARALTTQLMGKFQTENYTSVINTNCARTGLDVLSITLRGLNSLDASAMTGHLSSDTLVMLEEHIRIIAPYAKGRSADNEITSDILYQAIYLDCRCFLGALLKDSDKKPEGRQWMPHLALLTHGASSLDYGNMKLARRLLLAVRPLGGTEDFVTKQPPLPQSQVAFNTTRYRFSPPIRDILERIAEFQSEDIGKLFDDTESASAVALLLFNSSSEVRAATLDMIKTMSGQTTRRDAVSYLLRTKYSTTLGGLARALVRLEPLKPFVPAAAALKFLPDVVDAMCNQQDGLLRAATLFHGDKRATLTLWQAIWKLMKVMFNNTELWSKRGHDKQVLMDFCRDAMDFADKIFDQFGVLKGALRSADDDDDANTDDSLGRELIDAPKAATSDIIKWLRLRDEFLVAKSVALVCKLLTRLKDYEEQVDEKSLEFVIDVVVGTSKSTLSDQQKAELSRALETHAGITIDIAESETPTNDSSAPGRKNQTIDLERWVSKAQAHKPSTTSSRDEIADTFAKASPTYDKLKISGGMKLPGRLAPPSMVSRVPAINASEFKKKREAEMAERKRRDALMMAQQRKQTGAQASVAGEGSGARGLGVQGKEHDTDASRSEMYVDSSSDDDDDSMDEELFGGKQKIKKPASKQPKLTKEQAEAMRQRRQGPVKKQRLVRSHKDMRARLAPDLSPLHKNILSWDYFHEGGFPPGFSAQNYAAVLNSFRDAYDYQQTFQPLLVLEAWNGFLKAKEDNNARPYELKIVLRSSVDAFLEVSSTMSSNDAKEIGEGDIVLLSTARSPTSSSSEPHCLTRVSRITRKKAHIEVVYRTMPGTKLAPLLSAGATVYALKIMSVIPLEREYGALLGLQYYDLCDEIAKGKPSPLLKYSDELLQPHMRNYDVNKAQAKAIRSALDNDAFTLIQGPPGSGKTKTIVALCGALLTDSLRMAGAGMQVRQPGAGGPKKMMVCAPSNAAVDELVMRFKDGVKTTTGERKSVSIVRLGRSDAINVNVQDVTLEELVNKRLNVTAERNGMVSGETQKIMMEHKDVSERLRAIREKLDQAEAMGGITKELSDDFAALRRKKAELSSKIDIAKDQEGQQHRQADINRRKAQQEVLDNADIICATLSGSGHDMFQNLNIEFETVVVDEAAQCVELSCLIPLKYGCAKCILVGDPQQLPPTVFSKDAARFNYEQSLFVRMQGNHKQHVHLLDTQYRMHPEISAFPSKTFYESRLLDGKDMASLRAKPWHKTELLSPFRFFDVQGQHQAAPRGHSLINNAEINIAIQLYRRLTTDFRSYDFQGKIGIITPYKSQLRELKEQFKRRFGDSIADTVEFNTTDAFQGRESEVIIFSCVRASPSGGIGFLQDIRRMNVGLTRAKSSLWVLGNSQSLIRGEFWQKLVGHAVSSKRYTDGDLEAMLSRPLQLVEGSKGFSDGHQHTHPGQNRNSTSGRRQSGAIDVDTDTKVMMKTPPPKTMSSTSSLNSPTARKPSSRSSPLPSTTSNKPSIDPHKPSQGPAASSALLKRKYSSDDDVATTDAPKARTVKSSVPTPTSETSIQKTKAASKDEPKASVTSGLPRPKVPLPPRPRNPVSSVFMPKKPRRDK